MIFNINSTRGHTGSLLVHAKSSLYFGNSYPRTLPATDSNVVEYGRNIVSSQRKRNLQ